MRAGLLGAKEPTGTFVPPVPAAPPQKQLSVPSFVSEHDSLLEEQPLLDYGVVAAKEVEAVPGMPAPHM